MTDRQEGQDEFEFDFIVSGGSVEYIPELWELTEGGGKDRLWEIMRVYTQRSYRIHRLYTGEARVYYKGLLVCERDKEGKVVWVDGISSSQFSVGAKRYAIRALDNGVLELAFNIGVEDL